MNRVGLFARSIAVVLLLGGVASVVALASGPTSVPGRPAATATKVSNEKVQVAIASGKLLFVGASYTVGLGATTPTAGYAPVLAHRLDRRFTVCAASGTGFLNPGKYHQGTFSHRIAALPADLDPRIVVIQGGRNDVGYSQLALQSAARSTIRLAQRRFVHAQVVVMGPIPAVVPFSSRLYQTRNIIRAAARQTGVGFIDPIAQSWITHGNERQYAGPVAGHPNDAGYRYIAGRLMKDLPAALDDSAPPLEPAEPVTPAPSAPVQVLGVPDEPQPSAGAGEDPTPAPTAGGI